ncbi:CvpA family protein [Sphingomonas sp.]|jgi:membrane protein required for colicin V production|uniref:CvpA family protein n=1 Tax=Sphingomonas sp. TaxID=28214 RepID=UPI002D7E47D0|nr:CvpA family protein [Sphingomonas sp.]HEU0045045.1 CvpA family protein [Sphingomonas sp.]
MGLTALDMLVLICIAIAALLGLKRGFVAEVLSLGALIVTVVALKLFHAPLTQALTGTIGTVSGAAVLAFALLTGGTFILGRMVANGIGKRTRTSVLGPVDRALGFGFGALKGVILASLAFLLAALVVDTARGGRVNRPAWMTTSRTYPLLNATSAGIADILDRRRKGEPIWGPRTGNTSDPQGAEA